MWAKAGNFNKQQLCEIYALEAVQKWEEAAEKWEELAQPENAKHCWLKSNSDRAIARSSLGEPHAAIEDLNQAILLNPKLAAAYNNRRAVRRDLKDTLGALED
ncbi:hypothetical protein [Microcoleus sp. FACHB-672]|uniref:hypothetical protein n=1 Tax=Microcoleus sp. FACHB-672 TaxID=2692825 RepID=UPI0016821653|nr:hypothetical protein [Microcoleus sp. FACHB-672]MBD2042590.1 hypothetical protein [Microcoleus sp. FACHB-672]